MAKKTDPPPEIQPASEPPVLYNLAGEKVDTFNLESMSAESFDGPDWIGNFDPTTDEGLERLFRTQSKSPVDPDSEAAKRWEVRFWCIQRHFRFKNESGETALGVTTSFFDVKDRLLLVTSPVVLRFWYLAVQMRGIGPWENGLPVSFEQEKTAAGRRMIKLRVVK